ncbi:MAG: hypothetical protein R3E55_08165 [Burkholderiaceae bacterium]
MADSFSYEQLIASGEGRLFTPEERAPAPAAHADVWTGITQIDSDGGAHGLGRLWPSRRQARPVVFRLPFAGDLVMPGCLGLDAMRGN